MRIRRNASRILGSASTLAANQFPLRPILTDTAAASSSAGEINCSPLDLSDFNATISEDQDDDKRIAEITIKTEEEPIAAAAKDIGSEIEKIEDEKINEPDPKKTKELRICSKRAKGWDCKRPAVLHHSFCSYHLYKLRCSQSRRKSIGSNKNQVSSTETVRHEDELPPLSKLRSSENRRSSSNKKKKKNKRVPSTLDFKDNTKMYYYYGGFGPCRGKRRGSADDIKLLQVEEGEVAVKEQISDDNAADNYEVAYCNKNDGKGWKRKRDDGKGWKCKRAAEVSHSLCSHHLEQSRSYSAAVHKKHPRGEDGDGIEDEEAGSNEEIASADHLPGDDNEHFCSDSDGDGDDDCDGGEWSNEGSKSMKKQDKA